MYLCSSAYDLFLYLFWTAYMADFSIIRVNNTQFHHETTPNRRPDVWKCGWWEGLIGDCWVPAEHSHWA